MVGVWIEGGVFVFVGLVGAVAWGSRWEILGEAEVDEFEVAVSVEEDVFGFEVAVGYVHHVVEVAEDKGDFGGVELHSGEGKAARTAEVGEYFAAGGVFELE